MTASPFSLLSVLVLFIRRKEVNDGKGQMSKCWVGNIISFNFHNHHHEPNWKEMKLSFRVTKCLANKQQIWDLNSQRSIHYIRPCSHKPKHINPGRAICTLKLKDENSWKHEEVKQKSRTRGRRASRKHVNLQAACRKPATLATCNTSSTCFVNCSKLLLWYQSASSRKEIPPETEQG